MQFSTRISGNCLTFQCHESLQLQAEWLLDLVKSLVQDSGDEVLRDGYRFRVGWSMLTIMQRGIGSYVLLEPDFADDPFHGVRDNLGCTLSVHAEQSDFSSMIGVDPTITSFQDKVIYSKSCVRARRIYLERRRPRATDSGWFIGINGADNPNHEEELTACYAYELLWLRPEVMKVLQLPPGYLVAFDGVEIESVLAADNETVFSRKHRVSSRLAPAT